MNPEKLIEDLFDDVHFADYNLRSFTQDHLLRLVIPINNPGGIYTTIISDTTTKFNAFFGKIDDETFRLALREGLTISMESAKSSAIADIRRFEGLVTFQFGATSTQYQAFYPQGLSEYHDANLDHLPGLFTRFLSAANLYLSGTHPADVAALATLLGNFSTARNTQLTAFAEIETVQTGRRQDRKALTLQLTTNLLTIALNNLENPDTFNNYFNPSYLPLADGPLTVLGIINESSVVTAVTEGIITSSSNITLFNQGNDDLIYSISDQPGIIHPEFQRTVAAGNEYKVTDPLPVFEKYYLNVQNPNAVTKGKWKVVIAK